MTKTVAPTRAPLVKIPKPLQESLILQCLLPDFTIRFESSNAAFEASIKEVMASELSTKMSFLQQYSVISQHLDPKPRMQPMTHGASDQTGIIRYALSQDRFSVKRAVLPMARDSGELHRIVSMLSQACQLAVKYKETVEAVAENIKTTLFNDMKVGDLLKSWESAQTVQDQFLFCLMGRRVSMTSNWRGVHFYPLPSEHRIQVSEMKSKGGYRYKEYSGKETVNFTYLDTNGQFLKDGSKPVNILIKHGDQDQMSHCVAAIAVYCRWGFAQSSQSTRARDLQGSEERSTEDD